jgi:hypothetical protein
VSKVTEKIKTRSKPTPSEDFNSHPLLSLVLQSDINDISSIIPENY